MEGKAAQNLIMATATVEELKIKSSNASEMGKMEGKLIAKETRMTGSMACRVYASYIKAGNGYITVPFTLLAILGMQGCQISNSYTLVWWQENEFNRSFSFYQSLYAALGVSQATFTFLMGLGIDFLSMAAAKNLHHDSPMGRIIGVFGKDIDMSLRMFLERHFIIAAVAIAYGYIYFAALYRASARELKRLDAMLRSVLYAHLSESLTGLPTIRSYGEIPRFMETNKYYIELESRALLLIVTNQRWLAIRLDLCGAFMVFFVGIFAVSGVSGISPAQVGLVLTYASITSFLISLIRLLMTFASSAHSSSMVTRQSAELENYMDSVERGESAILVVHYSRNDSIPQEGAYESDTDHKPPQDWPARGAVEFKNVKMSYRPGLPNVLHGISMRIKPGEKIGVVGKTGAGKSSLALALLRIVEYSETIVVNELVGSIGRKTHFLRTVLGLKDMRQNISIIPQDPILFSGTVRTVLDLFGRYDDTHLWDDALRRSYLVDSGASTPISAPDQGDAHPRHRIDLDTVVETDRANLSVGKRSLLSLARALVKDSKVVILDKVTASVDLETDHKIQRTIQTQFKDNTLLCIARALQPDSYDPEIHTAIDWLCTIISYDQILGSTPPFTPVVSGMLIAGSQPASHMFHKGDRNSVRVISAQRHQTENFLRFTAYLSDI
ncbi:P-loop containing nucleoside triphosphate hydrolase protein [Mycena maculata]|uniref:P-loop containing nucleoside triphosphate hydrolase protein n=1 Tax=Mycena maculata TaxID=230809 RepID=A0AAD7NEM4_9AGAR|nr:P-loop containing nucleoside triphosphate hydrolase protein [Mycena maculata]